MLHACIPESDCNASENPPSTPSISFIRYHTNCKTPDCSCESCTNQSWGNAFKLKETPVVICLPTWSTVLSRSRSPHLPSLMLDLLRKSGIWNQIYFETNQCCKFNKGQFGLKKGLICLESWCKWWQKTNLQSRFIYSVMSFIKYPSCTVLPSNWQLRSKRCVWSEICGYCIRCIFFFWLFSWME